MTLLSRRQDTCLPLPEGQRTNLLGAVTLERSAPPKQPFADFSIALLVEGPPASVPGHNDARRARPHAAAFIAPLSALMPGAIGRRLKTSLDELRMQILGAQVLLGFQFQSLFQASFDRASASTRAVSALGLIAICLSLAGLIAPAAQHRLVELGNASTRMLRVTNRCAEASLGLLAIALGCDVFVAVTLQRSLFASAYAVAAVAVSVGMWFGVGMLWKQNSRSEGTAMNQGEEVDTHTRIEQMLTEARVILPGAQAMLGFQFIVTMTAPFNNMLASVKAIHFVALGALILSVVVLITPAAVHRLSFGGRDDQRFHRIGSRLCALALVPLAAGIALDFYVAAWRLWENARVGGWTAAAVFISLITVWYIWPLSLRRRVG